MDETGTRQSSGGQHRAVHSGGTGRLIFSGALAAQRWRCRQLRRKSSTLLSLCPASRRHFLITKKAINRLVCVCVCVWKWGVEWHVCYHLMPLTVSYGAELLFLPLQPWPRGERCSSFFLANASQKKTAAEARTRAALAEEEEEVKTFKVEAAPISWKSIAERK